MATWLGIDIGATAVKAVIVRSAYRRLTLEGMVSVDLEQVAVPASGVEGEAAAALDAQARVREAVRMAVTAVHGGTSAQRDGIATSIDGVRVAIRTLSLPASAQKQLGDVLPFELEAQVPFDMENAVFDYRVLSAPKAGDDRATVDVLAAVAKTDDVRARIDLVREAVLAEPERVGVGPFPLGNLVPYLPAMAEHPVVAIVDLGTTSSDVIVFRGGDPVFARTVSAGTKGLPATASKLAREIRVSLSAYRASGGELPTKLFLCGGGAFVSGAEGFLSGELEIPTELLPAPTLERVGVPDERLAEMPRFAKALGLALGLSGRGTGLNLRRGPLAYERGWGWMKEKVPVLTGLAAVLFVSFVFSSWAKLHAASSERETLEQALAMVTRDVLGEETSSAERANELLNQQTGAPDENPLPHADAFDVMVRMSESIPDSMQHDVEELDVNKGKVTIHGIVGSIPDAQAIATALQTEPCFQDVRITRTSQEVGGKRQKYVLELDIKCPEDVKGAAKKKDASGGGK
jgi:general secretion pathway protein L